MNQEPRHIHGHVEGVLVNIDGFVYALVEDGVVPLESRFTSQKFHTRPYISFGGQWYYFRDKGASVYNTNDINNQIRRYMDMEGRILQNGVENLEKLIVASIESETRIIGLETITNGPDTGIEELKDSKSRIGAEEKEKKSETHTCASIEHQFAQDEVMSDSKVMEILVELVQVRAISKALFEEHFFELEGKDLRSCRRTCYFWWIVVDIALAIACPELLNWAFATSRLWGENFGPYKTIPKETPQNGLEKAWENVEPFHQSILIRFINWWSLSGPSIEYKRSVRDENNLFGVFLDGVKLYHYSYKEENLLPMLTCLLRLKDRYCEIFHSFRIPKSLETMFRRQWPSWAIYLVVDTIPEASYYSKASIPQRFLTKFALGSADRFGMAFKYFLYRPLVTNFMKELLSPDFLDYERFKTHTLPILKALVFLATPGSCKILIPQKEEPSDAPRNESQQLSKGILLIANDEAHKYDPKSLKPSPPTFDFENFCSPWAENCVFHLLRLTKNFKDTTPILSALKQILGCGTSLRIPNLKGKLPSAYIVESRDARNPIKKELEEWLKKQDAYTPAYSTMYITKDTSSKKRPPNIVVPQRKKETNKELFELPEPICSDTLKYALIAGDIPKAKEAFENGDRLCPIIDGKHQTYAYWELMYEIVRQGRLESLKLLHERGFPLKDVLLRRHLFPTRNIIEESYGYNETDDDWPYEDAGDIHYRLIIEACKVGNLEMVRFLREVAKSSWSSNSESEFHYPTFWYTVKMDEALSKAGKEETNSEEISSASNSSSSSCSNDPSTTSSPCIIALSSIEAQLSSLPVGPTPAMDYFELQHLTYNIGDPMTDMPFSIYATVKGSLNTLKWMETNGWNFLGDEYRGGTVAHFALAAGYPAIVLWLLSCCSPASDLLTVGDNYGLTALDWALARKMSKLADIINTLGRDDLRPPQEELSGIAKEISSFPNTKKYLNCVPIEIEAIEWCDAPPKKLMPPISELYPTQCFSSFDMHDSMMAKMGLTDVWVWTEMSLENFKNIKLAEEYKHLRGPIEEFLTYRDTVLINMGEDDHNIKRVERWAKQEKSFSERHAKSPIPSRLVVSDFVRRISVQSNFEVDFWNAFCTGSYPTKTTAKDCFQNFLLLSQFAGVDMMSASVDAYKREWLEFEPCVRGSICPLLEVVGGSAGDNFEYLAEWPHTGVKRRQTSIFAVIARAAPWNGTSKYFLCRDYSVLDGWGTYEPITDKRRDPDAPDAPSYDHETHLQKIQFSPLIWMFTVLLPTARKVVAIVSEVFIEVALLGSIPMMEWLIDNCDVGDKTMDCYRMMMCQVVVFGTLNTLKWLHHRGFPLSFTPDDSGLRLEESCRFKTSEYMPVVPDAILLDFQERSMIHEKPIIVIPQSKGVPEIKLSRRPNFINALIVLYPVHNYVRNPKDVYFIERVEFLVRNGISLFEVDARPDGGGWDAGHYMMARGYGLLMDHVRYGWFKPTGPSNTVDKAS